MRKFWMVLGNGPPSAKHPTLEHAKREAERLARSFRGQSFTVLEAVSTVEATDVTWTDNQEVNQIPF